MWHRSEDYHGGSTAFSRFIAYLKRTPGYRPNKGATDKDRERTGKNQNRTDKRQERRTDKQEKDRTDRARNRTDPRQ